VFMTGNQSSVAVQPVISPATAPSSSVVAASPPVTNPQSNPVLKPWPLVYCLPVINLQLHTSIELARSPVDLEALSMH
jgi:hypothetical protein